jgi:hypothetical protein
MPIDKDAIDEESDLRSLRSYMKKQRTGHERKTGRPRKVTMPSIDGVAKPSTILKKRFKQRKAKP